MPAVATWPTTLPQYPRRDGYTFKPGSNVIESETETGPPKRRRRATARIDRFGCSLVLDADQWTEFYEFYHSILEDGSLACNWIHPETGLPAVVFLGDYEATRRGAYREVSFEVVVLQ